MKELFVKEKKKRNLTIAAVFLIGAVIFWFITGGSGEKKEETAPEPEIKIINEETELAEGFKNKYAEELIKLRQNVENIDNSTAVLRSETDALKAENERLKTELSESPKETNGSLVPPPDDIRFGGSPDGLMPPSAATTPSEPPAAPTVTVLSGLIAVGAPLNNTASITSASEDESEKMEDKADLIIPAGSFVKAELLSGVTAPTMGKAASDPVPSLIRVSGITQLPNFYRADIKECFVLAETKASLATEMVSFRLKTLSCKMHNGKTLERNIDGYVAGENGMEGMHGRVVSKQGTILGRTFIAEFLSGLTKAFGDSTKNIIASPSGVLTTVDPSRALESGAWSGAAASTNKLAEFYMELANQMVPVIEINAGRKVDLVFIKSINLAIDESKTKENK